MYNASSPYQHNNIEFSLIGVCAIAVCSVAWALIAVIIFNGRAFVGKYFLGERKHNGRDCEKTSLPPSYEEVKRSDVLPTYEEVTISLEVTETELDDRFQI